MSGIATALALTAALFHAGWNRVLKAAPDRLAAMAVASVLTALLLLPFTIAEPPRGVLPLILLSGLAQALYALALSAAYARGELALTYPVARGVSPLLITLGGALLLAEVPSPRALLGALLLALALALLAHDGRRRDRGEAVLLALLTGVSIAAYSVVDARAVRQVFAPAYLGAAIVVQALVLNGVARVGRARFRAAARPGLAIALGSTLAYLLVLFAFRLAPAGLVSTVRETSVPIAVLLSGERSRRVWAALALGAFGVVLAAL